VRIHQIAFSLLILAGMPGLVAGQTLSSAVIQQINASSKAKVRLVEGGRGTLFSPTADSSSVGFERSEFLNRGGNTVNLASPFEVNQVREIQVKVGSHTGKGAKIGAGVGAALALIGVIALSGDPYLSPTTGEAATGVVVWTGIGAGVGALIGAASPRWKTVYKQ
jgi:hypothetical protein